MAMSVSRTAKEPRQGWLQFAAGTMPRPELPRVLVMRAQQVLNQMKEIEALMQNSELGIDKLERHQARLVRWAEHVQWFAGGTLETQVQELKAALLGLGSGPSSDRGGAELAVWALAGSSEGAQLGLRLLPRPDKSLRELAAVGLMSTRNAHVIDQVLQHFQNRSDHLMQGLAETARKSGSALLGLAAIGELLGGRDFALLELPGSPVATKLDHVRRLQELVSDSNPMVRAAVVRAVGYAALGEIDLGTPEELKDWFKQVIVGDKELRVKFRALAAIPAFSGAARGELVHAALGAGAVELQAPALRFAQGTAHEPLNVFLMKRFLKLIESESSGDIPETHGLLADSLMGGLPPALEGKLLGLLMEPNVGPRRKILALRALGRSDDSELQDLLVRYVRDAEGDQLSQVASAVLQRGCVEHAQLALLRIAVDQNACAPARISALQALPPGTTAAVQRELLTMLASEDDQALLDEVVAAFERFKEDYVRTELRDVVANSAARENGRSAAIMILNGRSCDSQDIQLIRPQLKDGAFQCRLAAVELLCQSGLNGIESRNSLALVTQILKESPAGGAPVEFKRIGKACNFFLRSTGLL